MGSQSRIRVWKRLRIHGSQDLEHVDVNRRCVYQHALGAQPGRDKVGVGRDPTGACTGPRLQVFA